MKKAYEGEDVPIVVTYTDDADAAIAPDDTLVDPTITITETDTDTEVVTDVLMTENAVGEYEHVWDTATNFGSPGVYEAEITADFSSETKISKENIRIV